MFNRQSLALALSAATASCFSAGVLAGVSTLSSDEMVDTYVKDSAIIVVPRQQQKPEDERQRVLRALTISPGEPVLTEAEEEAYRQALQRYQEEGKLDALENAEQELLRRALLLPQEELARNQPVADFTPNLPPVIYGQQVQIPEEPFNQSFLNDQLGIGFDGQNLNFSIGNLPGVDQINMPRGINEGGVQLTPRPGGGFDLSIPVPQQ
jgi:hypothetical protein